MGLLLRPDVYYAKSPEGVYLLSHHGSLHLTGDSIYLVIERLAPYLNGRHSLGDLTANLSPERRRLVEDLVTTLRDRGALRDVDGAAHPPAPSPELPLGASFLRYFRADGAAAFTRFQATRTVVLGSGRLLAATTAAAVAAGLEDLRVVVTGETDSGFDPMSTQPGASSFPGPTEHVDLHPSETRLRRLLADVDLVLHASETPSVSGPDPLGTVCREEAITLARVVLWRRAVWISPSGVDWESVRRRGAARRPAEDAGTTPAAPLPRLAARAAAVRAVQGVLRATTGIPPGEQGVVTCLDPVTLGGTTHRVLAHPLAESDVRPDTEAGFLKRIAALADHPGQEWEEFSRAAVLCTGDQLGAIGEPDEGELAQFPLHTCRVESSDPVGLLDDREGVPTAVAAGLSFETARHRAVLRAFALYGSLMVDPRRFASPRGETPDWGATSPEAMLNAVRQGDAGVRCWAYDLADGSATLVAPDIVFPALRRGRAHPDSTSGYGAYALHTGTAAGYSWEEAVKSALLEHCQQIATDDIAASSALSPLLDPRGVTVGDDADRYRSMLARISPGFTFHEATSALGVPTVACFRAGDPVTVATGTTLQEALREAMERALLAYQADAQRQWVYAPTAPDLPVRRHDGPSVSVGHQEPLGIADLTARLVTRGRRPLAVPLDHDPEVSSKVPFVVRVVLVDA
ncbi:YcaO-like family protein [Spiractinospora alimapuensis]|uniref:YcaO-like family protein n=1 Tax=Spiractinospora alimapuensis TaxID=2820884 RepID=UPI001F303D68|nr:YcaO-like family protein [Spiractinospora alimapuensis]QVQ51268.1 YcaO-like family protein [Spiractinospora alimapuensis]